MEFKLLHELSARALDFATTLFGLFLVIGVIVLAYLYISDVTQTSHAIRRNYPVIGRFRYVFEHLGEFFRQYFFALDREELPFNRAQRSWVYRAAKNVDSTLAFGSTRPLNEPGDIIFLNTVFPVLSQSDGPIHPVTIGEGAARNPYTTTSVFNISAMSFGALSIPAIRALSMGAKKAGIWMNTGEGGLTPYHLEGGCDLVFQIGTAKFGVRDEEGNLCDEKLKEIAEHEQVRMFEIKLSQGAKPGKGGMLPGEKVSDLIASIRGISVGEDCFSPNGHVDIRSVDDLLDMIHHIREITGKPVGFKMVLGDSSWLKDLCLTIHERGVESAPDFITLDSADGGTGAAPQSLMDYVGMPLEASLPLLVNVLVEYGLKERIKVIASGKLINPAVVAAALAVGADFVVSARGFMFSLGCIQALQCNKNTCPTGITTHNRKLQKGLHVPSKSDRVASYAKNLMHEVCLLAHSCGVDDPREFERSHIHVISERGMPRPVVDLIPLPETHPEYR